jgi:carbamoyl-phosphate synthase large subunit
MNIQYVALGGSAYRSPGTGNGGAKSEIYVIEVNPRSSRTIPFISKVTGVPMVKLAINAMLGKSLAEQGYEGGLWRRQKLVAVKAPVFSMSKLAGVDTYLGPEMKSTGEVMGIDYEFRPALAKALMAAGLMLPPRGAILLSISPQTKPESVPMIRGLAEAGYRIYATAGTAAVIHDMGIAAEVVPKIGEGAHPDVVEIINSGKVDAVVNTAAGDSAGLQDGFEIRRAAVEQRIPCFTSLDTARSAVESLAESAASYSIRPLPAYRAGREGPA